MKLRKRILIAVVAVILLTASCFSTAFALSSLDDVFLQIGSEGTPVRRLQSVLSELGLYNGAIDGAFGIYTERGVRRLQRILGVPSDGQLGPYTISAYNTALWEGTLVASSDSTQSAPTRTEISALSGKVIGIDAGHQMNADTALEAIAPGSSRTKARMSTGAVGIKTGTSEYEINLQIAKHLQSLLEQAGATVIMTRTRNDVSLSNTERAQMMNEAQVDCWVRIHCNSSNNPNKNGVSVLSPAQSSNAAIYEQSLALARYTFSELCSVIDANPLAVFLSNDQAGFNWSAQPVIAVELGFITNPTEDLRLNRYSYQQSCARGIYNGLIKYFE